MLVAGSDLHQTRHSGMAVDRLIGQDRVRDMFTRAVTSGRVAHAYLLHGPDGSGKRAAALAFAQLLQCTNRTATGTPCGGCSACDKVPRMIHPDVHVLLPHTNDATSDDVNARVALLAESPYEIIDYQRRPKLDDSSSASNKQVAYLVERIHEDLRRPMSYRPAEGSYRIAVLLDADLMRTEAANAFLKLLEEPGENTVFLLLTSRLDHVLPTIMSRCQQVRFDPLPADAISAALIPEGLADPDMAPVVARMSDGSYTRARELASSNELRGSREFILDFLRQSFVGNGHVVMQQVDTLAAMGREPLKFQLQVLLGVLRDLVLFKAAGPDAPIVNVDRRDVLQKFGTSLPDARLDLMTDCVERATYLLERNANARLVLASLSRAMGQAMRGDASASVPISLTEF